MRLRNAYKGILAVFVLATISAPAWAQGEIRTVTHIRIKPDKGGDFVAAVRDLVALHTKAGTDRTYTTWQALSGPREYVEVSYSSKWAELDQTADPKMKDHAAAMAALSARLNACAESLETEIHVMVPELTSPRSAEIPRLVRTGRTTVAPGKMTEALDLFKNEVAPAWKKGGVAAFGVARVRYGAPNNQIHTFTAMNGWADLDGPTPAEKGMGSDAFQKFQAKIGAVTLRTEWTLYRYRPEMSYASAAK